MNRSPTPKERTWGEGPDGDKDVMAYISDTPALLSLLYDLDLLPEQHIDKPRDGAEWCSIFMITNHWRENELDRAALSETGTSDKDAFIAAFKFWYDRDGSVGGLSQVVEDHDTVLAAVPEAPK